MNLGQISAAVRSKLEGSSDLPGERYYDGDRFNPGKPLSNSSENDWFKLELIGGPTERIGMTEDGTIERRPLAVVEIGVPDGYGDSRLTNYEDALFSLFPPGLSVSGTLRVRSAGPFNNSRRREGSYLVGSVSIPLSVYY